jgi:hypothetical protein
MISRRQASVRSSSQRSFALKEYEPQTRRPGGKNLPGPVQIPLVAIPTELAYRVSTYVVLPQLVLACQGYIHNVARLVNCDVPRRVQQLHQGAMDAVKDRVHRAPYRAVVEGTKLFPSRFATFTADAIIASLPNSLPHDVCGSTCRQTILWFRTTSLVVSCCQRSEAPPIC